jgi:Fur family transcriptional regulator, peroxide stress response regulator
MQKTDGIQLKLKQSGLRMTPQRIAIYQELCESDKHPTAHQIHKKLKEVYPSLSLMTVYNTLNALVELGAIRPIGNTGDDVTHYDGDLSPHVNLACISCHNIIDIPDGGTHLDESNLVVPQGYKVIGTSMLVYGLCPDCQK